MLHVNKEISSELTNEYRTSMVCGIPYITRLMMLRERTMTTIMTEVF